MKNTIKTDVILKDFWRDNDRFADLFNTVIFDGERIIDPTSLLELDTDVSGLIELKGYNQTISRTRDIIKKTAHGIDFIIYGIENQTKIHYGMPLRNMLYDSLGYLKAYQETSNQYMKSSKTKTSDEFLSAISKEDRFAPIITIVIYYGEKDWDGPLCLGDMMIDMPVGLKEKFADYKMNLLQVCKSKEYTFKNEDVETVFDLSRRIYEADFEGITKDYKNKDIKSELGLIIGKVTNSKFIINQSNIGKETINMCTALENLKKEGINEGIAKGKIEIIKKSIEKGLAIDLIASITDLPIEEVKKYIA